MIKQLELCSDGSQKTEEYTIVIHDQKKKKSEYSRDVFGKHPR